MASLVENIISLENEADGIIEKARSGSKNIIGSVDDEIARYRDQLAGELESRLADFRKGTENKFQAAIAEASKEHALRLNSVKELPESFTNLQVEKILDRFNNW